MVVKTDVESKGINILIVDDREINLRLFALMLTRGGYKVRCARSAEQGLLEVAKNKPDLIILDILMPGMNGYDMCAFLKASEVTCDMPVIFISALNHISDRARAFEVGGAEYIAKPFTPNQIINCIREHTAVVVRG